ncbi:MAG: hypothetical protein IJR26_00190 [Bacteroidales bacterium]|nr:hypothetical protein [Bacteroidales bacterium]
MNHNDDIELMLFRYKEGMLDENEAAQVADFLNKNPEWRELADLYDPQFKAPPYPAVAYPGKEKLYKAQHNTILVWLRRFSAAATVVIAVTVFALWILKPNGGKQQVASNGQEELHAVTRDARQDTLQDTLQDVQKQQKVLHAGTRAAQQDIRQDVRQEIARPECNTVDDVIAVEEKAPSIIETDRLITYIDEDEEKDTDELIIVETDKLISYLPEVTTADKATEYASRPEWTYTVEGWWNSIQLAYTERVLDSHVLR